MRSRGMKKNKSRRDIAVETVATAVRSRGGDFLNNISTRRDFTVDTVAVAVRSRGVKNMVA